MVAAEEGDLQPEFLRSAIRTCWCHTLIKGLKGNRDSCYHTLMWRKTIIIETEWCVWISKDLFVSLFPSSETWPVVVSEAQEVVVWHQTLYGVPNHIYVHWLILHPVSKQNTKDGHIVCLISTVPLVRAWQYEAEMNHIYIIRIISCDQWNDSIKGDKDNNAINQK